MTDQLGLFGDSKPVGKKRRPQQASLFSDKELAQFGVNPCPLLPHERLELKLEQQDHPDLPAMLEADIQAKTIGLFEDR